MSTITESIGRVLAGRYRIESALGSGASANVFAAFDTTLQRRVAVKVLHPALAADSAFLRRFRSEAQSAAALANAHVLAVHDWGEDDQGPFLVLEFLGGGSLRDMFDEGTRLSVPQAVAVGIQAAEGLAYAHGRGFVHRDVKPANLLFDEEGRLRVADFGLARALAEAALTEPAGATVGTARYAAPEQALGHVVDGRADVYALALVLYEAVTGVVPFTADTTISTLMARVDADLPGHDALGPLAAVLDDAAAADAEHRLDAAALAARLRDLAAELPAPEPLRLAGAGGAGVVARPVVAPERHDLTEHGMSAPPAHAPASGRRMGRGGEDPDVLAFAAAVGLTDAASTVRRRRRRRWPWVVAVLVVVLGLAAAGTMYALRETKLLTPSHKLPVVTGLTTGQADAALRKDHFHVTLTRQRYSITAPVGQILRQIPAAGTKLKEGSAVSVVESKGPPPVPVPVLSTVTGDCPNITTVLAQAHLKAACTDPNSTSVPKGTVIDWNPKGTAIYGSIITVTVSAGPPIENIPSLTGQTCSGATTTLQAVGLVTSCVNEYTESGVPSGQVIDWSPTGQAPQGATVTVHISQGPPLVTVPSIIGQTVAQAITILQNAKLVPGTDQGPLGGKVFDANPGPGTQVPEGTTVTLYSK
ncbi:MAG TPA: PASTA domain-containing protein [Acidimicrobiales bacterium]|nr:PASTA domain-containing protein [Acidimicrobiales bacterium]